jgi:hypothetical protein
MKTYEVVFDEDQDKGIYAVSVVENPAMESMFIALSSDQDKLPVNIQFKESDVAKKENTLIGVALIPDKEVYRNVEGDEFNIVFGKETIKKAAHSFLKNGYQNNSSVEHEDKIEGVSIVESWIVKDPENDTANAYQLSKEDIVEGTWVVKMKCDNEKIYKKAVSGEIKGFSIDGLFSLKEVNLKSEIEMSETNKKGLKDVALELFNEVKALLSKEVKLAEASLEDGTVIAYEGDTLEAGVAIFVMNEEEQVPLPAGEYTLEGGAIVVVEEDGVVASVSEASEEEEEMELSDEQRNSIKDEVMAMIAELSKDAKANADSLKESKSKLEVELAEAKAKIEELEAKLKAEPAQEPVKHADKEVKLSENPTLTERIRFAKSKF